MNLPDAPSSPARSFSRWILLICVVIAAVWPFRMAVVEGERSRWYRKAVEAYTEQDFGRCSDLMERTISMSAPSDSAAVLLREKATCLGLDEQYSEQLDALIRAKAIAERVGQDSVARETSISIGNVVSYCQQESSDCRTVVGPQSSNWEVSNPVMIVLLCLAGIGLLYVVGADQLGN